MASTRCVSSDEWLGSEGEWLCGEAWPIQPASSSIAAISRQMYRLADAKRGGECGAPSGLCLGDCTWCVLTVMFNGLSVPWNTFTIGRQRSGGIQNWSLSRYQSIPNA